VVDELDPAVSTGSGLMREGRGPSEGRSVPPLALWGHPATWLPDGPWSRAPPWGIAIVRRPRDDGDPLKGSASLLLRDLFPWHRPVVLSLVGAAQKLRGTGRHALLLQRQSPCLASILDVRHFPP
jgi:hypothetical protein